MLEVAGGSGGQYGKTNLFGLTSHGWMDGLYRCRREERGRKGEVKVVDVHTLARVSRMPG